MNNMNLYSTQILINCANNLEHYNIVSEETAIKIRSYIRREESPAYWELFLIIGALLGAIFASAGVFAIISHNWDDFPKHLRGFFSVVPLLVGLYFYYRMLFYHKDSKPWVEASSLFLMMMIGASIALVSQTYQMDGDFTRFIKVWMVLTIPLFYLARASGIASFYLLLSLLLLFSIGIGWFGIPTFRPTDEVYWYWLLLLAFLPHYYFSINRNSNVQGIRTIFLSYCLGLSVAYAIPLTVEGNYILWTATVSVGFYLFGKRFMGGNMLVFARPFQFFSQFVLVYLLIGLSNEQLTYQAFRADSFFNYESWNGEEMYYFILLIVVLIGVYFNFFKYRDKFGDVNPLIVYTPLVLFFMMILYEYTESWWWISLPINVFILMIGVITMVQGSENNQIIKVLSGLLVIAGLLTVRYFDTSLGFISKGILFLAIGGMFFLISLFVKEKVDDIERFKRLTSSKGQEKAEADEE